MATLALAKSMGHVSEGMVLAAEHDGTLRMVEPDGEVPGCTEVL